MHSLLLCILLTSFREMAALTSQTEADFDVGTCGNVQIPSSFSTNHSRAFSLLACGAHCLASPACNAFSYWPSLQQCQATTFHVTLPCENYTAVDDGIYMEKVCLNGGVWNGMGCTCCCGFLGQRCERAMEDCAEGYPYGYRNGFYSIQPPLSPTPFRMHCGPTGGSHILVRLHGTDNFTRTWSDYRDGFGTDDFWVGLQNLHFMTHSKLYYMYCGIQLANGTSYASLYKSFRIGDEASGFQLSLGDPVSTSSFESCLLQLNGSRFSAPDVDNDNDAGEHCARDFRSGWWFNACANCNPTGERLLSAASVPTQLPTELFWRLDGKDVKVTSLTVRLRSP